MANKNKYINGLPYNNGEKFADELRWNNYKRAGVKDPFDYKNIVKAQAMTKKAQDTAYEYAFNDKVKKTKKGNKLTPKMRLFYEGVYRYLSRHDGYIF